jgi:general secretion pathway protein D
LTGIPGVGDIPLLKYLFGSTTKETDRSDLLIFLIPHIVRSPDYSPENLKGIFVGNESIVKINYAPSPEPAPTAAAPDAAPPAPGAVAPAGNPPAAAIAAPANGNAVPVVPPTAPPPPPPPPGPAAVAVPPPVPAPAEVASQARLSFQPGVVQVSQNAAFTLAVQAEGVIDAFSASPLQIKFDPAQVRLNDAAAGELLSRTGGALTTAKDIRNDTGDATLTIALPASSTGVTGSGTLATLTFTSLGRGTGTIAVVGANLKNSQAQPIPAALASVVVTVQ